MGKLVLLLADGTTQDVPLTRERIVIGRRADNDVCLPHPAVSGEHAAVVTILADSFLEDLGSTNGTLVNGKPIVKHFLRDHDQIDIGRQRLVFVSDDGVHVDPLPIDVARGQLLGLDKRVEPARPPASAAAPTGRSLRGGIGNMPVLDYPQLDDEELQESPAVSVAAPARTPRQATLVDHRPPPTRRESDQRLAAWAAEWAAPTGNTNTGPVDTSYVTPAAGRAAPDAPARAANPVAPAAPEPIVRVLSGPNLGRAVPFRKDELSVGRVGVQVAVVRKVGSGFRLVPVEGAQPPRINGIPVDRDGTVLHPGDTFEVAGVRLELSVSG
ncbi:MAG TPA: FHA domain-containing protein [Casimicrobiaceae bacterium]|nr:FHA domain-containing protein [Casimicrobiaceae bacterium]